MVNGFIFEWQTSPIEKEFLNFSSSTWQKMGPCSGKALRYQFAEMEFGVSKAKIFNMCQINLLESITFKTGLISLQTHIIH